VLGLPPSEIVKETVVSSVDEKLGSSRVWCPSIGHGEGVRLVTDLAFVLILNVSPAVPLVSFTVETFERGVWGRTASPCASTGRVLAVWAAKLTHKSFDYAVECEAVIELRLDQVGNCRGRVWHLLVIELDFEGPHSGLEGGVDRHGWASRSGSVRGDVCVAWRRGSDGV